MRRAENSVLRPCIFAPRSSKRACRQKRLKGGREKLTRQPSSSCSTHNIYYMGAAISFLTLDNSQSHHHTAVRHRHQHPEEEERRRTLLSSSTSQPKTIRRTFQHLRRAWATKKCRILHHRHADPKNRISQYRHPDADAHFHTYRRWLPPRTSKIQRTHW